MRAKLLLGPKRSRDGRHRLMTICIGSPIIGWSTLGAWRGFFASFGEARVQKLVQQLWRLDVFFEAVSESFVIKFWERRRIIYVYQLKKYFRDFF